MTTEILIRTHRAPPSAGAPAVSTSSAAPVGRGPPPGALSVLVSVQFVVSACRSFSHQAVVARLLVVLVVLRLRSLAADSLRLSLVDCLRLLVADSRRRFVPPVAVRQCSIAQSPRRRHGRRPLAAVHRRLRPSRVWPLLSLRRESRHRRRSRPITTPRRRASPTTTIRALARVRHRTLVALVWPPRLPPRRRPRRSMCRHPCPLCPPVSRISPAVARRSGRASFSQCVRRPRFHRRSAAPCRPVHHPAARRRTTLSAAAHHQHRAVRRRFRRPFFRLLRHRHHQPMPRRRRSRPATASLRKCTARPTRRRRAKCPPISRSRPETTVRRCHHSRLVHLVRQCRLSHLSRCRLVARRRQ